MRIILLLLIGFPLAQVSSFGEDTGSKTDQKSPPIPAAPHYWDARGLLAFSFAMLEVSDSLILAEQQQHFPITKAIYALISSLGTGPNLASALGVWAMVFLAITIVGAGLILGRKLGALFRV